MNSLDFLDCIKKTVEQHKLALDSITYWKEDTQGVIDSTLEFATGEADGQLRRDCKLRRFNLAAFRFGSEGNQLSDDEAKKNKVKKVTNIYLGSHTETYTIVGKFYIEMMTEIFRRKRRKDTRANEGMDTLEVEGTAPEPVLAAREKPMSEQGEGESSQEEPQTGQRGRRRRD